MLAAIFQEAWSFLEDGDDFRSYVSSLHSHKEQAMTYIVKGFDAGAIAAGKALVNDLDLEVVAPDGTHYYGNAGLYTSGQCLRQQSTTVKWDAFNNVEGVYIPNARYGTYTIYVHGYNVPNGPQPFALVASGDYLLTSGLNKRIYLPMVRK